MIHTEYGLSVKNNGFRLYPGVFPNRSLMMPLVYQELLRKPLKKGELNAPLQKIDTGPFLRALSELKLQCIGATALSGLFAWERNACVYYTIRSIDDQLKGRYIAFEYHISGTKEHMCERLEREFTAIINQLYGELRQIESA
jgi:hypothetical protein